MVTNRYGRDLEQTTFHHNGDYSGEVTIVRDPAQAECDYDPDQNQEQIQFVVPYEHLEQLVLDKLRKDMVNKLEDASHAQLRQLFFNT